MGTRLMQSVFLGGVLSAFAVGGLLSLAAGAGGITPSAVGLLAAVVLGHVLVAGVVLSLAFGLLDGYEGWRREHPGSNG